MMLKKYRRQGCDVIKMDYIKHLLHMLKIKKTNRCQ